MTFDAILSLLSRWRTHRGITPLGMVATPEVGLTLVLAEEDFKRLALTPGTATMEIKLLTPSGERWSLNDNVDGHPVRLEMYR